MLAAALHRRLRTLRDDREGGAIIEFAFVAPILMLFVVGIVEVAMILFVSTLLEGSVREAARYGITGYVVEGHDRIAIVRSIIARNTLGLVDMDHVDIKTLTYSSFSNIGMHEPFTDSNGNGVRDSSEAYTDVNGNGKWDEDMGIAGLGGPGDIVVYTVTYDWPMLTSFMDDLLGRAGIIKLQASYAVRNEPWDIGIVEGS